MNDDAAERAIRSADSGAYMRFTGPSRLDKALHTLEGLLRGIAADGVITKDELIGVQRWVADHAEHAQKHPFNEIIPFLDEVLADGKVDEEEARDVLWLCEKLTTSNDYFAAVTSDMQRLQGMLGGIAADGQITEDELRGLEAWMAEHEHLKGCWPFDELESVIIAVMKDGQIDRKEHEMPLALFSEFTQSHVHRAVDMPVNEFVGPITGFCAVCPEVAFADKSFCFTGRSARVKRREFAELIEKLGGRFHPSVRRDLDYLVIGGDGNPAWAFACYGRKVEQAIELRKTGSQLTLVHENDFWDAVADMGA